MSQHADSVVRSMRLDPLSTLLCWRMNWHTEHHMYAGVPCYNLKRLYREIADDMPAPRSLIGAWREMNQIWKRQYVDPGCTFDTPLPPPRTAVPAGGAEQLAASIGDLAPDSL